jgi:hypothetical protein
MKEWQTLAIFALLSVACNSPTDTSKNTSPQVDKTSAETQLAVDQVSGKEIRSATNEIDGKKTFSLSLFASKGSGTLVIRCSDSKDLDVYVAVDELLESNAYDRSPVRYKTDGGPPKQEWWIEAKDYKAAFSPAPKPLLNLLGKAHTFMFEYSPYQDPSKVVTFDLANFATGLPKLRAACGFEGSQLRR